MTCHDNEIDILEIFQLALSEDYEILTADSEEDCIDKYFDKKKVKAKKIDILLLDYRLDDMQGDTVAKKVKELNDVKVIIVSAYDLEVKMVEELKAVRVHS
jgi:DNA-binding response OmpR family regulator